MRSPFTSAASFEPRIAGSRTSSSSTNKAVAAASRGYRTASLAKREGTSTTFGQMIVPVAQKHLTAAASLTKSATRESFRGRNLSQPSVMPGPAMNAPRVLGSVRLSKTPNAIPTSVGLMADASVDGRISPNDTLVKIISNPEDLEETITIGMGRSNLDGTVKSGIAMAAASSTGNASVVVPSKNLIVDRPKSLVGSVLTNVSAVTPNVIEYAAVLGSSLKTREEIKKTLTESAKIDLGITLKSKLSEVIEFNSIKTPDLESNLTYNFFVDNESNLEEQEDQSRDPLLSNKPHNVPKYVSLQWTVTNATEPLTGTERIVKDNSRLRKQAFYTRKGVFAHSTTNFMNSIDKEVKKTNPYKRDGKSRTVVDIHDPVQAFSLIANGASFANTVKTTLNTSKSTNVSDKILFLNLRK